MSTGSFAILDIANITVKGNVFLGDEGGTGDFIVTFWDIFKPISEDQFDIINVVNGILTGKENQV